MNKEKKNTAAPENKTEKPEVEKDGALSDEMLDEVAGGVNPATNNPKHNQTNY
ncbi:MAG: hypothetical protein IKO68_06560 [Oscillospiraceae bacterium]|nr:hypothetical protein [Oscillospiraceae bacterium]